MMCLITVITIWFLVPLKFDPLKLFLWAVSLTGANLVSRPGIINLVESI